MLFCVPIPLFFIVYERRLAECQRNLRRFQKDLLVVYQIIWYDTDRNYPEKEKKTYA